MSFSSVKSAPVGDLMKSKTRDVAHTKSVSHSSIGSNQPKVNESVSSAKDVRKLMTVIQVDNK